jgi:hypothetical protein
MSALYELTQPQLYRCGGTQIDAAVADPSVCFIETGDSFGFLLSESAYDGTLDKGLHLEQVLWIRCAPTSGWISTIFRRRHMSTAPFQEVALYRHPTGIFVAQEIESKHYFPRPSDEPYVVIFISLEQYDQLRAEAEEQEMERLVDSVQWILQGIPQFSFDGRKLDGPSGYAGAEYAIPSHEMMKPDE